MTGKHRGRLGKAGRVVDAVCEARSLMEAGESRPPPRPRVLWEGRGLWGRAALPTNSSVALGKFPSISELQITHLPNASGNPDRRGS